jgi:hypothetical protein
MTKQSLSRTNASPKLQSKRFTVRQDDFLSAGAARVHLLAKRFGLSGRVDLYHAFVAAMTMKLGGGVLGLLCSNCAESLLGALEGATDGHW